MGRNYAAIPHEYLAEMEELTDAEFGRLVRGLLRYSMTGEAITADGNERFYVRRVISTEDKFQSCFEETDKSRSERARHAANARWNNAQASSSNAKDAQASSSTPSNAKNAINIIKNKTNINNYKEKEINKEKESADAFDRFWSVYPKKVGKGEARKAFAKVKGVTVDTLISAVEQQRQSRQWTADNGRYIPNPSTWLNQGRWEDDIVSPDPEKPDRKAQCCPADYGMEGTTVDRGDIDWLISTGGI